jgi:hypothetical protein
LPPEHRRLAVRAPHGRPVQSVPQGCRTIFFAKQGVLNCEQGGRMGPRAASAHARL